MPPTGGPAVPARGVREAVPRRLHLAAIIAIGGEGTPAPGARTPRLPPPVRGPTLQEGAIPRRGPRAAALRAPGPPQRKAARPIAGTGASVGHPRAQGRVGAAAPRVARPLEGGRVALPRLAASGVAVAGPVRAPTMVVRTEGVRQEVAEAGACKGHGPRQVLARPVPQLGQMAAVAAPARGQAVPLPVLEAAPPARAKEVAARVVARVAPCAKRPSAEILPMEVTARHGATPRTRPFPRDPFTKRFVTLGSPGSTPGGAGR